MSKRRRKKKVSENSNQGSFMEGLNPQMLDMLGLGDVDVNKVSEVLSSMGSDGFDMNSINSILNNKDGGKNNSSKNKSNKKGNMNNNPLSAIMGGLLGYPLKDIRKNGGLSNTSLTILETLDGGKTFKPVVWNETSYLGRKLSKTDSL